MVSAYFTGYHEYKVLFDPLMLHQSYYLLIQPYVALEGMIHYLRMVDQGKMLSFHGIVPDYISNEYLSIGRKNIYGVLPRPRSGEDAPYLHPNPVTLEVLKQAPESFEINTKVDEAIAELKDVDEAETEYKVAIELIKIANLYGVHFIVTDNKILLKKKLFLETHGFNIVTYPKLVTDFGIFLRGNGVFIDDSGMTNGLEITTFYRMTEPHFNAFDELWAKLGHSDATTSSFLRSAFYHRYSWLRYAQDMVLFYRLQIRMAREPESGQVFNFPLAYHANQFYLQYQGFLDNLAWALNHHCSLGISLMDAPTCTFSSKKYQDLLTTKDPALSRCVYGKIHDRMKEDVLEIKRHPAAHRQPLFPGTLSDESGKIIAYNVTFAASKDRRVILPDLSAHIRIDRDLLDKFLINLCWFFELPKGKNSVAYPTQPPSNVKKKTFSTIKLMYSVFPAGSDVHECMDVIASKVGGYKGRKFYRVVIADQFLLGVGLKSGDDPSRLGLDIVEITEGEYIFFDIPNNTGEITRLENHFKLNGIDFLEDKERFRIEFYKNKDIIELRLPTM